MTNSTDMSVKDVLAIEVDLENVRQRLSRARAGLRDVIYGQDQVIDLTLLTLLSGGHGLLVGLPGLAKTKLVDSLGRSLGLDSKRVQFTPDLMPGDILGSELLDEGDDGRRSFRFEKGPIFCQLLMADEINRASPRTQSALLQAMQEHHVTVAGHSYDLPRPFHVLATQNPLEQEGTYPLPEAQLDRFLMQIDVHYPDRQSEKTMLLSTTGVEEQTVEPVFDSTGLLQAQRLIRHVPVGDQVVEAILDLVRAARPEETENELVARHVSWGPGPRASQALMLVTKAKAILEGRLTPSIADIISLAKPVLKHRMALTFAARAEGLSVDDIIDNLCNNLGE